jgi:hypothetical protein
LRIKKDHWGFRLAGCESKKTIGDFVSQVANQKRPLGDFDSAQGAKIHARAEASCYFSSIEPRQQKKGVPFHQGAPYPFRLPRFVQGALGKRR